MPQAVRPVLAVLLLVASGCAAPERTPSDGAVSPPPSAALKRIVLAMTREPIAFYPDLNPAAGRGTTNAILDFMHPGLNVTDNAGVYHPALGEAVPSVENGLWTVYADGTMETTHPIRAGATWHDGTPFTADDLVFSATVARDRELPLFRNRAFDFVERVEAAGPQAVRVTWSRLYIDADTMFSVAARALPQHLLREPYATAKASFTDLRYWTDDFVGLGPYRVREFLRGSHLTLTAVDGYVLGRPPIDEIEIRIILDFNAVVANLLAGTVEATNGTALGIDQAATVREQWKAGRVVINLDGWVVAYAQFVDPKPAIVLNRQFRAALLHAVDRQQLVDTLMDGLVPVADSVFTPGTAEYQATLGGIVRHEYDLRRATTLLEQLGYGRGGDGVFRDANGERLALEVRAYASRDMHVKTMLPVVDAWQRLGLAAVADVRTVQQANDRQDQATFAAFLVLRQPNDVARAVALHTSEARLPETNYSGSNNGRYRSPELDQLIDGFLVTIPRAERMQVATQIVRHFGEQLPLLPFFYDAQTTVITNRLVNVDPGPNQTWNAHQWDVRR
jgi:peptide/nickel transport system substrate-binding protein